MSNMRYSAEFPKFKVKYMCTDEEPTLALAHEEPMLSHPKNCNFHETHTTDRFLFQPSLNVIGNFVRPP